MNATVRPEVDVYIQDALSQTANWLPRWLDQVSVVLKNLEAAEPGAMERKALNTARLEADRHRESLVEAYRAELEASTRPQQAGAGLLAGDAADVGGWWFAGLALLGHVDLEQAELQAQLGEQFAATG